jgi:hypothetical protein
MTKLQVGRSERPAKGAWKKDIAVCTKRGHHLFRVKGKQMVCTEPGCDYVTDWVKKGPMPVKNPGAAKRKTKR